MNFQNAAFESAAGRADQLPRSDLPEIVFSGRSNVGKSSLINKLLNRKALARVSATPGKTATINFYRVDACRFADLPGYGYAKVSKREKERWAGLVEGYFAQNRRIALVVQLVDMRHDPSAEDVDMINFLLETGLPFVVACTKSDKLNKTQTAQRTERFHELFREAGIEFLPFSAVTGGGAEDLKRRIAEAAGNAEQGKDGTD